MYAINHVGLTVADIEASAGFYAKFGFEPVYDEPYDTDEHDSGWIKEMTGFGDARLLLAHFVLDGLTLELLQYVAPEGKATVELSTADAGSAHLAFTVDDIAAAYESLRAQGVEFRSSPVHIPEGRFAGVRSVYLEDPDGNTVELNQVDG